MDIKEKNQERYGIIAVEMCKIVAIKMINHGAKPEEWWKGVSPRLKTRENIAAIADTASDVDAEEWFDYFSKTPFDVLTDK
jgi:hypothetical protein